MQFTDEEWRKALQHVPMWCWLIAAFDYCLEERCDWCSMHSDLILKIRLTLREAFDHFERMNGLCDQFEFKALSLPVEQDI